MFGLSSEEAKRLQLTHGKNTIDDKEKQGSLKKICSTITEPMFLFLVITSIICFIIGEMKDGIVMLIFVIAVISIDFFQNLRTDKSINALKKFSDSVATVIRDGKETQIKSEDIVPGDIVIVYPGIKIPADGIITECSSLYVDESSLTGETELIEKTPFDDNTCRTDYWQKDHFYAGTFVISGTGKFTVTEIGNNTEYGKTAKIIRSCLPPKTPLQNQINSLIKTCTIIAMTLCIITCVLTLIVNADIKTTDRIAQSILSGISLAMATIPEEFPIVLTVCFSLGAIRLTKKKAVIRNLSSIETLGCISVLCVDKTGTLTQKKEFNKDSLIISNEDLRTDVQETIKICKEAGIRVIMITGDDPKIAKITAEKSGINAETVITGKELQQFNNILLQESVKNASVFAKVTPEQKKRIVEALQQNGEIVAMTGDGVNDAAALKLANIGIAMGKAGTEVAKEAADIILLDDKLSTIPQTIKDGRRIYDNIKKSVSYLFSIHIPIIFTALLSPILGLSSKSLFLLPANIALLEILIDPTCSIIFESLSADDDVMKRSPRSKYEKLLSKSLLIKSVLQGLSIFVFSFVPFYVISQKLGDVTTARTFGICVIIVANLFLVFINRSDRVSVFKYAKKWYKNKTIIIFTIITILVPIVVVYTPISGLLNLTALSIPHLLFAVVSGIVSVSWWEIIKLLKKADAP